jgi:hypothetical protein
MKGLDKGGQGPTSGCCAIEEVEEVEEEEEEEEEEDTSTPANIIMARCEYLHLTTQTGSATSPPCRVASQLTLSLAYNISAWTTCMRIRCLTEPFPSSGRLLLLIKNLSPSKKRPPVVCFATVV